MLFLNEFFEFMIGMTKKLQFVVKIIRIASAEEQ